MERQIGEIFQDGEVTLKVVEQIENEELDCKGCHYLNSDCSKIKCIWPSGTFLKSVIFVKQ